MTKYKLNQDLRTPSQVTLTSYMVGEGQTDPMGKTGETETRVPENKDDLKSRLECRGCSAKSKYTESTCWSIGLVTRRTNQ